MKISLTKNAELILEQRYLRKDEKGGLLETPEGMFRRVARSIALSDAKYIYRNEIALIQTKYGRKFHEIMDTEEFKRLVKNDRQIKKTEEEFYKMMSGLDFLPNSPTLLNAGTKSQQMAACFVLPIDDDISSIFMALHNAALIHKTGAGTGFNFSRLRPKGDLIEGSGVTSGPVSFMKIYDAATEQIKMGGRLRGANMGILNVDHPDIEEAICAKKDPSILTNFNISISVTDKFFDAVKKNRHYNLVNYRNREIVRSESARKIFDLICEQAWLNGDPGMIFQDTINKKNPTPHIGILEATDSCGEQPLYPYESCNLGSINLSNFIKNADIDYERLRHVVHLAVHFLDNVIDVCQYPLSENRAFVERNRKIGLGVMGFADALIKLNIPYDSEKGIKIGEKIMKFISDESDNASASLAETRGVFPEWEKSIYNRKSKHFRKKHVELRNVTRTTIAPTGTISIIAGCSSGIEPLFALSYVRTTAEGKTLYYFNEELKEELTRINMYDDELVERLHREGTIKNFPDIPEKIKKIFLVGSDIDAMWHVKMQAAFQKYVDNGISKTVTLPKHATVEDVGNIFLMAHEMGCKGISIYRYGSREGQVISISSKRDEQITLSNWIRRR